MNIKGSTISHMAAVHPGALATGSPTERRRRRRIGYPDSLPGVKKPEREVNHEFPYSTEDKNERSYISTPTIRLHDLEREKFTSFLLYTKRQWF